MNLIYAPGVRTEMQRIYLYIAQHNRTAANDVLARIEEFAGLLLDHPDMGRKIARGRRRLTVAPYPYLIYYEVADNTVRIIRIRHAARYRQVFQEPARVFVR
jgi:plasmid stabilization system protein ParE